MDPVRKFVAGRLAAQVAGQPHPDAELLSAFAENVLSPQEREGILQHLGACAACREVLFLALPDASDTQKVLAVPKFRPRFAMRWATLAASIAIVAAVLVVRHKYAPTTQVAQKVALPADLQQPTVAMNKVPAEIDAVREAQASVKTAPKARPEEKHITAKPSVTMNFEQSGQVQVEPASPSLDLNVESRLKDLPVMGRDAGGLVKVPTVNAPAAPPSQNMLGQAASDQRAWAYSSPGAFAKQAALHGSLGGVVIDGTGAVVANAKVTRVGPTGTETLTVGADGKFSFDHLPPGQYSLKAAAPGFKVAELNQVAVLAGQPSDVRMKLDVGATSEMVEVAAAAVAVPTDRADKAKLEADQSVNGLVATTAESEVVAEEKNNEAQLRRKKMANARQAAIGGPVGAGAGTGPGALVFQWTLSPEGAVQRSLDGGKTWLSVSVPGQASFRTLSAVGRDIWVGGKSGSLYHSPDSGQQWTRIVPEVNGEKLNADVTRVSFSDLQNGVIGTSDGQVWATSDGGQTWQRK